MVQNSKEEKELVTWQRAPFLPCLTATYFCNTHTINAFSSSTASSHRLFLHTQDNTYVNMTLQEKKKKTKMQRKKNDRGLCFPALQVKNHVHQILLSTQFRRGQKSQIPLRGLDDLSGLFSPDILRFLQTQPQGSGADIKTVRRDFPGGPVIETQRSQCRGCTFDPCLGNWDPTCRAAWPKIFKLKKKGLPGAWVRSWL